MRSSQAKKFKFPRLENKYISQRQTLDNKKYSPVEDVHVIQHIFIFRYSKLFCFFTFQNEGIIYQYFQIITDARDAIMTISSSGN